MVTWPLLRMSGVGSWVPLRSGWHSLLGLWVCGVVPLPLLGMSGVVPLGCVVWSPGPSGGEWCGPLAFIWGECCGLWVPLGVCGVVWSPGPSWGVWCGLWVPPGVSGVVPWPLLGVSGVVSGSLQGCVVWSSGPYLE